MVTSKVRDLLLGAGVAVVRVVVGRTPEEKLTLCSLQTVDDSSPRSTRAGSVRSLVKPSAALATTPPLGAAGTSNLRRVVLVEPLARLATTLVAVPVTRLGKSESVYASWLGVTTTVLVVTTVVVGVVAALAGGPTDSTPPATARTVTAARARAPRRRCEGEGQDIVGSRGWEKGGCLISPQRSSLESVLLSRVNRRSHVRS